MLIFTSVMYLPRASDYKDSGHGVVPENEIQIYTWPDASLREIADLVKDVILRSVQQKHVTLTFALVYPDKEGRFVLRNVGRLASFRGGPDDKKTLADVNFQTGDYLDILVDANGSGNGRPEHRNNALNTSTRNHGGRGGSFRGGSGRGRPGSGPGSARGVADKGSFQQNKRQRNV